MFEMNKRMSLVGLMALVLMGCGSGSEQDVTAENTAAASGENVSEEGGASESVETVPALEVPEGDPGLLGPHAVGHTELTIADPDDPERMLEIQLWYPAEAFDAEALTTYVIGSLGQLTLDYVSSHAQRDVPAAKGPFPFVIFSHGYGGIATQSLDLCERLASHGFVVASPAHAGNTAEDDFNETSVSKDEAAADRPRDVRTLVDTFTDDTALPAVLAGLVDADRIGVTGHSFGGFTSLSAVAGYDAGDMGPDPRVKAVAPICPGTDYFNDQELSEVTVPVAFIGGTLDASVPIDPHVTRPYKLIGSPHRLRVDVIDATHTHFANICTIGNALMDIGLDMESWEGVGAGELYDLYNEVCGEDAFPIEEAIRIQTHYVVAFFKVHLSGEAAWELYLSADYAAACEPDIAFYNTGESAGLVAPPCLP